MAIKLIAVDMDGTFLDNNKSYNKQRFLQQYARLKQKGIYFVAASGNPMYTLQQYFPEIQHEIAFVAENGAYVMDAGHEVTFTHFQPEFVQQVLSVVLPQYQSSLILCSKHSGFISCAVTPQAIQRLNIYFKYLQQVLDITAVEQPICKITFDTTQCDIEQLLLFLQQQQFVQQQLIKVVSSGFGFVDLIIPQQHKATGLNALQNKWHVNDAEMLAIGDNYNDIEMIQKSAFGFAMDNAVPELKKIAKYQTGDNNTEAVLDVIDAVLDDNLDDVKWQSKHS